MSFIENKTSDNISRILVGNKTDLEDRRAVSFNEGREMASHYGIQFFETSAKEGDNVDSAFIAITRDILNNR